MYLETKNKVKFYTKRGVEFTSIVQLKVHGEYWDRVSKNLGVNYVYTELHDEGTITESGTAFLDEAKVNSTFEQITPLLPPNLTRWQKQEMEVLISAKVMFAEKYGVPLADIEIKEEL